MKKDKLSTISQARTLKDVEKFWHQHNFTEFDTDIPNVEFTISPSITFDDIEQRAQRGNREKFDNVLDKVAQANLEPLPEDHLPSIN